MCAARRCLGARRMEMMGEKRLHARIVKSSIGDLHLLSSDVVKPHSLQIVA